VLSEIAVAIVWFLIAVVLSIALAVKGIMTFLEIPVLFLVVTSATTGVAGAYAVMSMAGKCLKNISNLYRKSVKQSIGMRYFWDIFVLSYACLPGVFSPVRRCRGDSRTVRRKSLQQDGGYYAKHNCEQ
jgi:hypothetical protein